MRKDAFGHMPLRCRIIVDLIMQCLDQDEVGLQGITFSVIVYLSEALKMYKSVVP